jgi:glyoxylase-like metal-dependent hydrolase (beta-lactamase superfamily II)
MANYIKVTPQLWQLKLGAVNSYLLKTEDGLLLVDSGYPNKTEQLYAAVKETGNNPEEIRHLILTHGHIDHAGGAAEIKKRTGARIYAHKIDLELIEKGEAARPGTSLTPGIIPALVYFFFIKFGGSKYEPVSVDQLLEDGEVFPFCGGIEIIHTPGHSAGQVALLLKKEGILIAGDICSNVGGLNYSVLNEDIALARQTILKVAKFPFKRVVFGHGDPLNENASQLMLKRFSNSKLK